MTETLIDRGADRPPEHRFCVVCQPRVAGDVVQTDRGDFEISHVGKLYTRDGIEVANHYLVVSAADIGAPDHLTDEQLSWRAASKERQLAGARAWLERTKDERSARAQERRKAKEAAKAARKERRLAEYRSMSKKERSALTKAARAASKLAYARRKDRAKEREAIRRAERLSMLPSVSARLRNRQP